jgi:hypothetical protein
MSMIVTRFGVTGRVASKAQAFISTQTLQSIPIMASSTSNVKGKSVNGNATTEAYELPWYAHSSSCTHRSTNEVDCRVEKYRPRVLDDVVGNSDTIERLKVIARDGNCPHLIISVCASHIASLFEELCTNSLLVL